MGGRGGGEGRDGGAAAAGRARRGEGGAEWRGCGMMGGAPSMPMVALTRARATCIERLK